MTNVKCHFQQYVIFIGGGTRVPRENNPLSVRWFVVYHMVYGV